MHKLNGYNLTEVQALIKKGLITFPKQKNLVEIMVT